MSACDALAANAPSGVAPALRAVDCLANEAAATAFSRLFGSAGSLTPALTILLTLYIAFFAMAEKAGWALYDAGAPNLVAMPNFHVAGVNAGLVSPRKGP